MQHLAQQPQNQNNSTSQALSTSGIEQRLFYALAMVTAGVFYFFTYYYFYFPMLKRMLFLPVN